MCTTKQRSLWLGLASSLVFLFAWDGKEVAGSQQFRTSFSIQHLSSSFSQTEDLSQVLTDVELSLQDAVLAGSNAHCVFDRVEVDPFLQDTCGAVPLCGASPVYKEVEYTNASGSVLSLEMHQCCPVTETVPQNECQKVNPEESCRVVGTKEPFCDARDPNQACKQQHLIARDAKLAIKYAVLESERTSCCQSCTCYGDPRCVSFNGVEDAWVLCDARGKKVESQSKSYCTLKESTCEEQRDHDNNQCQWVKEPAADWVTALQGSPCVYNFASSEPWMLMYAADEFRFEVRLGERGIIDKVKFQSGFETFTLSAGMCWHNQVNNSWLLNEELFLETTHSHAARFVRRVDSVNQRDVFWTIHDLSSDIIVKLRCSANEVSEAFGIPRINVEELVELTPQYETSRENLAGFCVTDVIAKSGTTNNTDVIEAGEGCVASNGEREGDETVAAARAICRNPSLLIEQVESCFTTFCSAYYFPFYSSEEYCLERLLNDTKPAFCTALKSSEMDIMECINDIQDFGWEAAVNEYLLVPAVVDEEGQDAKCGKTSLDFPTSLSSCQQGTSLQYLVDPAHPEDEDAWITHFVIPDAFPPCLGIIHLDPVSDYPLFVNPIRFKQCSMPSHCLETMCDKQGGIKADLRFSQDAEIPPVPPQCQGRNLCSQSPIIVEAKELEDHDLWLPDVEMQPCCSVRDAQPRVQAECEQYTSASGLEPSLPRFVGQECRVIELAGALCSPSDFTRNCTSDTLKEASLELELSFVKQESSCCDTCSCYGDPHCLSFDNHFEAWILCDAREPVSTQNNNCHLSQQKCETLLDHDGHQCSWLSNEDSSAWDVPFQGSPCVPNPASRASWLLMYQADSFRFEIEQGERSVIQTVSVTAQNRTFTMSASHCLQNHEYDSWTSEAHDHLAVFNRTFVRIKEFEQVHDVVWIIHDEETGIRVQLRCTAPLVDNRIGKPFINVEGVIETALDYRNSRKQLDGYCVTNTLNKRGSTENTDLILSGQGCDAWGLDEVDDLEVLRLLCNNPTLSLQGMLSCKLSFCSAYSFPNYETETACLSAIDNHLATGFCTALTSTTRRRRECEASIQDFGWEASVNRYLGQNHVSGYLLESVAGAKTAVLERSEAVHFKEFCIKSASALPRSLSKCQSGVVLQYQENPSDPDSWVTYVAIPDSIPLCPGFAFSASVDEVLFTHPIRLRQCSISETCAMNFCGEQSGVKANIRVTGMEATVLQPETPLAHYVDKIDVTGVIICNSSEELAVIEAMEENFHLALAEKGIIQELDYLSVVAMNTRIASQTFTVSLSASSLISEEFTQSLCEEVGTLVTMACSDLGMIVEEKRLTGKLSVKYDITFDLLTDSNCDRISSHIGQAELMAFFSSHDSIVESNKANDVPTVVWFVSDRFDLVYSAGVSRSNYVSSLFFSVGFCVLTQTLMTSFLWF